MNTPQKKKEKKLFLNFFRDNSIIEWNKVEKLWQDRDGPIHARTIATSRPWGCSFNIQSDALRRSRPDLFQNNCANAGPSIDATCEFLRNSPLLEVPRPNPIRGEGRKKERKKKSKEAATVLFDVSMDECRKKRGARNGTETCDELRVKSFWTSRPPKMNTDKRSREERLVSFACDTNNEAVSGLDGSLKLAIFRESGV